MRAERRFGEGDRTAAASRMYWRRLSARQRTRDGLRVPRYFFTIHRHGRAENDPDGTYLPDAEAALSYAEHTIRELRKKSGYKDLALMMFVTDQSGQTVLSLPFFPGC